MKKYIKPTATVFQVKLEKVFAMSAYEEDATSAAMTRRRMWMEDEEDEW